MCGWICYDRAMRSILALAIPLSLALAACADEPDMPSAEQNEQLDEAEAMLDEASEGGTAVGKSLTQEGPDAEAPDPPETAD